MPEVNSDSSSISVLIADDHPIFRFGLSQMIKAFDEPFHLVAEAADGQEAWDLIFEHRPTVAVLDIGMPKLNGLAVAANINKHQLNTNIVVLSSFLNTENIYQCFRQKVMGVLLKETAEFELRQCLEKVALGKKYISEGCKDMIKAGEVSTPDEDNQEARTLITQLTDKEKEVLRLIGELKASKEIAKKTNNSVRTIDNHRFRISKKLNLDGHGALAVFSAKFNHLL